MKRITFLAITAVLLSIGAAKAQLGVHVGLNFGTPGYYHPYHPYNRVVIAPPPPVYYGPAYYPAYYRQPTYLRAGYYSRPAYYYHTRYYGRPYRRW